MKFKLLEELVKAQAKRLDYENGMGGGKGDPDAHRILSALKTLKENLIIKHDLRPSEIESELPEIDVTDLEYEFSQVINAAKLELIKNIDYEELQRRMYFA